MIFQVTKTSFTVANQGQASAGGFSVEMVVGGQLLQTWSFPKGLDAGASAGATYSCRTGTWTVVADAGKQVDESNGSNNSGSHTNLKCP